MPALAKPPAVLPRHLPHGSSGANAGAGPFSRPKSRPKVRIESKIQPDNIDRLAHDARNILSGLTLYCELLAAPGVLTKSHAHYARDLEGIAGSASQILDRILEKIIGCVPSAASEQPPVPVFAPAPVTDSAADLRHLQPLLAAIAGPAIRLSVATTPCPGRAALAVEDLTRILVNLVRNAADAMPAGGHIRITAQYAHGPGCLNPSFLHFGYSPRSIVLTVADDGPGIPEALLEQIFDLGFTTRSSPEPTTSPEQTAGWPSSRRRGLGLSIVRDLVETAGGTVRAVQAPARGALFEISLPLCDAITSGTYAMPPGKPILLTPA